MPVISLNLLSYLAAAAGLACLAIAIGQGVRLRMRDPEAAARKDAEGFPRNRPPVWHAGMVLTLIALALQALAGRIG